MVKRRDVLKMGLAAGGSAGLLGSRGGYAQLCDPDGRPPVLEVAPSPAVVPFTAPLFIMPVLQPVPQSVIDNSPEGPVDPDAHQRYNEFLPQKYYVQHINEFRWVYHPSGPYAAGAWHWGFDGLVPGATIVGRYGEPILVRRFNDVPPVGVTKVTFALPSFTVHHHNGHQASESDGIPQNYFNPGEIWDYHFPHFPAGSPNDPLGLNGDQEVMNTLWYHDHRLDFTATNVYAGIHGFYLLFDRKDSGDENDTNPEAFRLPSGKYDVPLMLNDVLFALDANGEAQVVFDRSLLNGWLGDKICVNRTIEPFLNVERRKYRFRILNSGPSRLYQLFMSDDSPFLVLTTDGNMLPEPLIAESLTLGVAERHDVIIDFSRYQAGQTVEIWNRMEQTDGAGPTGRLVEPGMPVIQFRVVAATGPDNSRIPDVLRPLPAIDLNEVIRERDFVFDYDGGVWTINGKTMVEDRIDVGIRMNSAEIWTFRNAGTTWSHPVHTHFEEFQILKWNGVPIPNGSVLRSRKDVATIGPGDTVTFFGRWRDFEGLHVMHCHNVVHEDHAMMLNWKMVPAGQDF